MDQVGPHRGVQLSDNPCGSNRPDAAGARKFCRRHGPIRGRPEEAWPFGRGRRPAPADVPVTGIVVDDEFRDDALDARNDDLLCIPSLITNLSPEGP